MISKDLQVGEVTHGLTRGLLGLKMYSRAMYNVMVKLNPALLAVALGAVFFYPKRKSKSSSSEDKNDGGGDDLFDKPASVNAVEEGVRQGADLIASMEGYESKPYSDPGDGTATIGYGNTFYQDGSPVTLGDPPLTQSEAQSLMEWYIMEYSVPILRESIPVWGEMNEGQIAATLSFAYNMGPHFMTAKKGFNSIQSAFESKDWRSAVPDKFPLYKYAGGKVLAGLVKRRRLEAETWRHGSWPLPNA